MASLGFFLAGQGHPHATRQSGHPQNDPTMVTVAAVAVVSFRGKVKPDTHTHTHTSCDRLSMYLSVRRLGGRPQNNMNLVGIQNSIYLSVPAQESKE